MVSLTIRKGEATLTEKLFENDDLKVVLGESEKRRMQPHGMRVVRVTKDGEWKSTEESTVVLPVIYLADTSPTNDYLICQRPGEGYALFKYRWTS